MALDWTYYIGSKRVLDRIAAFSSSMLFAFCEGIFLTLVPVFSDA
jgi:hypothetical protein